MHTDKAYYQRAPEVNLENHITIIPRSGSGSDLEEIEALLTTNLDKPFTHSIPPWRIVVLPLRNQFFVAFAFSHTIGDGLTGLAFHRTFLDACRDRHTLTEPREALVQTPRRPLPEPFDTPERLTISWRFLLPPLLAVIMPSFLARLLGIRASASVAGPGAWTGSQPAFEEGSSQTRVILREVEPTLLEKLLCTARKHNTKLTGLFHQFILRALCKAIPSPEYNNFVSLTAVNMRRAVGVSNEEMGEYVSGCYIVYPRVDPTIPMSEENWAAANSATQKLATAAVTLQDQAIGLLRYAPSIRNWTISSAGKPRDSSFDVSNIGIFESHDNTSSSFDADVKINKMVFAQPGHVDNSPLAFNLVTVKGGSLLYTVTWLTGSLDIGQANEEDFVNNICSSIQGDLEALEL
jgi:hypothetical protein